MHPNLVAFLTMLAVSEGTAKLGHEDGYDVLVGSTSAQPITFGSYADHPRLTVQLKIGGNIVPSSAAGRYQILARFFDVYKKQLGLKGFYPADQDAIAVQMIRECGAVSEIKAGNLERAVQLCKSRWASLPGAGYGQHENSIDTLRAAYLKAGGQLT